VAKKGKKSAEAKGPPVLTNRRARHDYHIERDLEAGLVLMGSEVKSLRAGKANIAESYCNFVGGELFWIGARIEPWPGAVHFGHEPDRSRKLLLHGRELDRLSRDVARKGCSIVPLKLFWSKGRAKLKIGVGTGKSHRDQREDVKKRQADRDIARVMRRG
jgi:SsrA-binding protein